MRRRDDPDASDSGSASTSLKAIDVNLLVALDALLRHQHVTRAARELGVTQSTMSHALSRLREQFEDPLFVVIGRTLVLTERARSLVQPVMEARAGLERVFAPAERFDPASTRRSFRIAATDNLELYVLPSLVAQLNARAPRVDLRVVPLPEDWVLALQRGDIDLKLGRAGPVPPEVRALELSRESFSCVVRLGHPCPSRPTIHQLSELGFLVATPSSPGTPSSRIDDLLAEHGLQRRVVVTVPHFLVAPFVVERSDLAWIAPTRMIASFKDRMKLREIELPFSAGTYRLSQVWAARRHDEDAIVWLRSEVSSSFDAADQGSDAERATNKRRSRRTTSS